MNARTCATLQVRSDSPCKTRHGADAREPGDRLTGAPGESSRSFNPSPLHSRFCSDSVGQKPIEIAPANVPAGACASIAYTKLALAPTPTSVGGW